MSDLSTIHFRSFVIKREEVRQDQNIVGYVDKLQTLGALLVSLTKIGAVGDSVDQMLKILHESAIKNNDFEAIGKVEIICKELREKLK